MRIGISWLLTVCISAIGVAAPTTAPTSAPTILPGAGSFTFVDQQGDSTKPITVWTWSPDRVRANTPILFVMHGTLRNGETYRDNWIDHAKAKNVLLIVPEFDRRQYPGVAYNDGNMFDHAGSPIAESHWAFSVIEHLFDEVKQITGDQSSSYYLYGHSAGGQFVERFLLFMPHARYARAIAANPGWYTLPELEKPFPAGLKKTECTADSLKTVMSRDVILMLGEKDTNPNDPELPKNPEAIAEGPFRFARGQFFFHDVQTVSQQLNVPLNWQLHTVPTAGHSDVQMSSAAAELLFSGNSPARKPER